MKTAVIVNPVSGRGKSLDLLPKMASWCENHKVDYRLFTTGKPGDGITLARLAKLDGFERIVVLGGDGSINEVAQGVLGSDVIVAALPGGSGNDFYRMLGNDNALESGLDTAFYGKARQIDVGLMNGRPFVNAVGIGFDAEVAARAAESKALSGKWVYLIAVFKTLIHLAPREVDIELDQLKLKEKITLISIGNGRSSGGGFFLTPQAMFDDGLLDVCVIEALPKRKIFQYLPRTLKGTHIRLPGVRIYRTRKIVVKCATAMPVHIDGEIPSESVDRVEIMFDRRKLQVAMPDDFAGAPKTS